MSSSGTFVHDIRFGIFPQNNRGKKLVANKTEPRKGPKETGEDELISPTLRRSSRSCSRAASEAISHCVEVGVLYFLPYISYILKLFFFILHVKLH